MGFYEDDRIRRKNQPADDNSKQLSQPIRLELGNDCSLAKILEVLKDAKFKVSLRGKNTLVVE